ncbi:MAG: hypothetical protein P8J87_03060, partial [Verrucomicrobiales bacterium]|nr:hypothetical protein [Verrucomicrobiales bacterium]
SWHHVAMVREGERIRVYLNGNPKPDIDGKLARSYPKSHPQFFLGGRNDNFANLKGSLDEVALYDRALTPEEVLQNFQAITGDIQFAQDFGEWDFDSELVWAGSKPPATDTTVMIGGGFNIGLFSEETVDQLVLGHQSDTIDTNGTGTLQVSLDGTLNTNSLVIGGTGTPGTANNLNVNDGGTVNVTGDLIYGLASDQGGNVRVNEGGTLNVTGSVIERVPTVNTAQLYLNGGAFSAAGNISVQSFRTGDSNGSIASYNQPATQTITNTGTFFTGNNGLGTHTVEGGTLLVDNSIRVSERDGGFGSSLIVESGSVHNRGGNNVGNTNKQLDLARRGDATVVVNGGTFTNDAILRFGNDAPTIGSLTVNGGTFIQNGDITTGLANDGSSTSSIVVNGGTLDLRDNGTQRSLTEFTQTDGDILFRIRDTVLGPKTIEITDFLTFTTTDGNPTITPTLDLPASVDNGDSDTWTGTGGTVAAPVSGTWNTTNENWLTTAGSQLIPAAGGGALDKDTEFVLFTAALINDFENVSSNDPEWSLSSDGTSITATYSGDTVGSAMPALISGAGVTVTRDTTLLVAPNTFGVDTTQLTLDAASLQLSG